MDWCLAGHQDIYSYRHDLRCLIRREFFAPFWHDNVIKWKHFPRYWPYVRGIHRSPVNSPHKGQGRGALIFFFDLRLNKRLSKQSWGWWFKTPSCTLWCHCNVVSLFQIGINHAKYLVDWRYCYMHGSFIVGHSLLELAWWPLVTEACWPLGVSGVLQ